MTGYQQPLDFPETEPTAPIIVLDENVEDLEEEEEFDDEYYYNPDYPDEGYDDAPEPDWMDEEETEEIPFSQTNKQ